MDYKECLTEFKKSLKGGSEFDLIIEGVQKNISTNRIRWFDVGIGDGKFLKKIATKLEELGYVIEISGIDVSEESVASARERFSSANIYCGDFLDFELTEKYDIFSFNQTIYYFHNKNHSINKCLNNLAEGGLILGVVWSAKDKIYQFHQKLFGKWTMGAFSSENLGELFNEESNLSIVFDKKFVGTIDFGLWKNSDIALEKNLHVISRIPLLEGVSNKYQDEGKELIQKQKNKDARINGVIIGKKSYEIKNINNKTIIENLKKKFPNYQKLVPKICGDIEALYMSSWEKETEYLSEKIKHGRILEICCAAGLKTCILAQRHRVVAIDINKKRLECAKKNLNLFKSKNEVQLLEMDAENVKNIKLLGDFDAIVIDVDWRENVCDPIKKQNINPFKTCPRTDKLYNNLRKLYPEVMIIFKVSPFTRVKEMAKLDPCLIEELYIDNKFLSYNVYYSSDIKKSKWQQIRLFNGKMI